MDIVKAKELIDEQISLLQLTKSILEETFVAEFTELERANNDKIILSDRLNTETIKTKELESTIVSKDLEIADLNTARTALELQVTELTTSVEPIL